MSFADWLKGELVKSVVLFQIVTAASWKYEAMQSGQSYNAVAEAHTEAMVNGLTEWVLSFGPRVGAAIVSAPIVVYGLYRGYQVMGLVETFVARHGLLRSLGYAGVFIGAIALWFEAAAELPPWARPQALVRPQPSP